MCLVIAITVVLLTLLGCAGERLGFEGNLRANTVKRWTHSYFRQGREYYRGAIGKLATAEEQLWKLFSEVFASQRGCCDDLGLI
mgnify:CR=1 FL=1